MSEESIEKEIQEKGLTAPRLTPSLIDSVIKEKAFHVFGDTCLTVCCLTLQNGFTVTGESACASPENFNQEIGEKIAFEQARNKIWMLEGYLLKDRLHCNPKSVKDRVMLEQQELHSKLDDLVSFIDTEKFNSLNIVKQGLLVNQSDHMLKYLSILEHRISIWDK